MCWLLGILIGIAVGVPTGVYFKEDILGGAKTVINKAERPKDETAQKAEPRDGPRNF